MNEQEQKLQQEILADARRKAERAVARARRDVEKERKAVEGEMEAMRRARIEQAERAAAERYRAVTAGIRHEVRRAWLERREAILEQLFADVLPLVRGGEGVDRERSLRSLVGEAFAALGPGAYRVRVAPADVPFVSDVSLGETGEAWSGTSEGWSFTVEPDEGVAAGVIVEDLDGRRRFDNRCDVRLHRLKDDLRASLCEGLNLDLESVASDDR